MNPILKNILAIIAGIILGSLVNMGIISISGSIIPPPEGADISTMEGLRDSMHLFEPKHFLMPFLAHALGTFIGAMLCAKLAANNKIGLSMAIGIFFLIGGIASVISIQGPMWFNIVDLTFAYLPASYLGARLVAR
jgi:hypothetical protein